MRKNLLVLGRALFDKDGDDGGGSAETMKVLGEIRDTVKASRERTEATATEVAKVAADLATLKSDTERDLVKVAKQSAQVRRDLAMKYGPSGADDWLIETQKFLRGVTAAKFGGRIPDADVFGEKVADLVAKAAADFTTTTDATAGYLLPSVLMPGIRELLDIYGNFYPAVTKVKAPAGHAVKMNRDSARPTATWRGTQLSGITESGAGGGGTDSTYNVAQDTVVSELLGSFVQIANELLGSPHVNFAAVLTVRMLHAILRKLEFGLISGTEGAGEPSDGLIADAGDRGSIASMTFENLITFLQRCITANEYAFDTMRNKLIMTPADALALASQSVGTSELKGMLVWGDPRKGVPTTVMGYELLIHPAANNGTNKHVLLVDPGAVTLVEDSAPSVDVSAHAGNAFTENASILRVFNHYDWNIGQPTEVHKCVVTA